MKIAEQLKALQAPLAVWNQPGGKVEIATDIIHFLGILTIKSGTVYVAILFNEELPRGDMEELGRVDRSFLIGVSRGRSLTLDQGQGLTAESGAGRPLFDLVEEARDVVLGVKLDSEGMDEVMPYYKGIKRIQLQGWLIDAYQIEVALPAQNPEHRIEDTTEVFPG